MEQNRSDAEDGVDFGGWRGRSRDSDAYNPALLSWSDCNPSLAVAYFQQKMIISSFNRQICMRIAHRKASESTLASDDQIEIF
jgi:hypothetical protein